MYCGLCNMSISGKSMFKSSVVVVGDNVRYDDSALFECKNSEFNHSFHIRCIRHMIETELSFSDKQNKRPIEIKDLERYLRCPTCLPKSQDFALLNPVEKVKKP